MKVASQNLRTGLGVGAAFILGGAVFMIVLYLVGRFQGQRVFPLIPADQRKVSHLEMPVLSDSTLTWKMSDQAGKVVVVNYFATWCGPCMEEEPELKQIYADYSNRGVVFVAVGMDTDQDRSPGVPREKVLRQFASHYAIPFPILLPPPNLNPLEQVSIPQTFVYDRQGRLARWIDGGIGWQNLRASLDQLLAEK